MKIISITLTTTRRIAIVGITAMLTIIWITVVLQDEGSDHDHNAYDPEWPFMWVLKGLAVPSLQRRFHLSTLIRHRKNHHCKNKTRPHEFCICLLHKKEGVQSKNIHIDKTAHLFSRLHVIAILGGSFSMLAILLSSWPRICNHGKKQGMHSIRQISSQSVVVVGSR